MQRQRQKQKRPTERPCALQAGSGMAPVTASGRPVEGVGEQSDEPVTEPRRVAIFVVRTLGPGCPAHVHAARLAHACLVASHAPTGMR